MDAEWVREICMSFPGATEQILWGDDLVFKAAGKMFAAVVLVPAKVWLSFKASPENFAELTERNGIIPAPYAARARWVALETKDALLPGELAHLLRESYDLVLAKLPRRTRDSLSRGNAPGKRTLRKKSASRAGGKKSKRNH